MMRPENLAELVSAMKHTEQFPGISMVKHGQMVNAKYIELYSSLRARKPLAEAEWRIPDWLYDHATPILESLLPLDTISRYQTYHDCGKPYCRTIDAEGRAHYPDHARISSEIWLSIGGSEQEARLMAMDMDAHTIRADGFAEFAARPEAWTLWLTALCELHANSMMFGGIESAGFKIKWKRLEKLGRYMLTDMLSRTSPSPSV